MQVLWINDNSLSRITNLDYNPTIKSLYAHNNRIGTLKVWASTGRLQFKRCRRSYTRVGDLYDCFSAAKNASTLPSSPVGRLTICSRL